LGSLAHAVPYTLHLEEELVGLLPELEQLAVLVVGMKCGVRNLEEAGNVVAVGE
jgi:hypothetical protein